MWQMHPTGKQAATEENQMKAALGTEAEDYMD